MANIIFEELSENDSFDFAQESYYDDYALTTPGNGDRITINLTSNIIDPFLQVYDFNSGILLYENDDGGDGLNSQIQFFTEPNTTYVVRASSFSDQVGVYNLDVNGSGQLQALSTFDPDSIAAQFPPQSSIPGRLGGGDPTDADRDAFYDDYLLTLPSGSSVTIELTSSEIDSYLEVYRQDTGELLDINDDSDDGSLNSELTLYGIPGVSNYIVRASSFSQEEGSYNLEAFGLGSVALQPLGNAAAVLTTAPPRASLPGTLNGADPQVQGKFYDDYNLTPGSTAPITIEANGDFDTYIYVYDKNGRTVAFDDDGGLGLNSLVEFTPEARETYTVRVTSYTPAEGNYTLTANSFANVALAPASADVASILNELFSQLYLGSDFSFLNDPLLLKVFQDLITANSSLDFKDYSGGSDSIQLGSGIGSSFAGGIRAFDGDDFIVGSAVDDVVNGNQGNDSIDGGEGNDYLRGGQNNDMLIGDTGDDLLNGNKGNDVLEGGEGNDYLRGGLDDDLLVGGEGNDILIGDKGFDILRGESGADTFLLRGDLPSGSLSLADRIEDFQAGIDRIGITEGLSLNQVGLQSFSDGTAITIAATGEYLGFVVGSNTTAVQNAIFTVQPGDPIFDRVG
ncbi:calcium-binding protein [[Phormidium] sp. ETS-05]|uniref:calcium-binding protein n=1 Tax=[Phormidium] sp. ETS-05 TaxID=222819 RepID=UPI0018EF19AC|nr:calcium-binding protein [[Phormidium] sp. ETS-05]